MRTPSLVGVSFTSGLDVEVVQRVGSTCEPVSGSAHTGAAEAGVETTTTLPTMRMLRKKRRMNDVLGQKPLANLISCWEASSAEVRSVGASLPASEEVEYQILDGGVKDGRPIVISVRFLGSVWEPGRTG
jgi:hypothetical protein